MKHIIIEGIDQTGKSTLIKSLCEHFNYDNLTIRHFSKPPKNFKNPLEYQKACFLNEKDLLNQLLKNESNGAYFENILIWNRSYLGEFVHGHLHRGYSKKELKEEIINFEKYFMIDHQSHLILLLADSEFCMAKEDGNSLSKNIIQKTLEIELFKEIYNESLISNKKIIYVNQPNTILFKDKNKILLEVLNFIK